jgi:hypothetical protein
VTFSQQHINSGTVDKVIGSMVVDLFEGLLSEPRREPLPSVVVNGTRQESGEAIPSTILDDLLGLLPARFGFGIARQLIYRAFRKEFNWWQAYILTKLSQGEFKKVPQMILALKSGEWKFNGLCLTTKNGKTLICLRDITKV